MKFNDNGYYEYVLTYMDDILTILMDATVILKSMEEDTVKYKMTKIEPPEMCFWS